MGYEIIYDRAFLRTTRGIIPMILHGSNNCSDFVNGREVAEKYWSGWNDKLIEFSENNLHDTLASIFTSSFGDADYELFKWHGKWIRGNELEKWFKAGIKNAMTLEEIRQANPSSYLDLRVMFSEPQKFDSVLKQYPEVATTKDLEFKLDDAKNLVKTAKEGNAYISIRFLGREPLRKKQYKKPLNEPCLVKCKLGYFASQNKHSTNFILNPKNGAKVFANEAEAQEVIGAYFQDRRVPYKLIKASTVFAERPYALLVTTGEYSRLYIQKRTSKRIYFTSSIQSSWRFTTEKEAEKAKQRIYDSFGGPSRVGNLEVISDNDAKIAS